MLVSICNPQTHSDVSLKGKGDWELLAWNPSVRSTAPDAEQGLGLEQPAEPGTGGSGAEGLPRSAGWWGCDGGTSFSSPALRAPQLVLGWKITVWVVGIDLAVCAAQGLRAAHPAVPTGRSRSERGTWWRGEERRGEDWSPRDTQNLHPSWREGDLHGLAAAAASVPGRGDIWKYICRRDVSSLEGPAFTSLQLF